MKERDEGQKKTALGPFPDLFRTTLAGRRLVFVLLLCGTQSGPLFWAMDCGPRAALSFPRQEELLEWVAGLILRYLPRPRIELGLSVLLQCGQILYWAMTMSCFLGHRGPGSFVESKFGLVFGLRAWVQGSRTTLSGGSYALNCQQIF